MSEAYKPIIDWDDPAARGALIDRIGIDAYNAAIAEHHEKSAVAIVNGYRIRPVGSRFGTLMFIDGANSAYVTLDAAKHYAATLEPGPLASKTA